MTQQKPILRTPTPEELKPENYVVGESLIIQPQIGIVKPAPKHWYQSKTVWFNVFVIGASLATTATPALEQYMSPESYGLLTAVVGVVNAVLRFATSRPIATPSETTPSE